MATLTTLNVDMKKLGEQLKSDLPSYAQPKFIRLTKIFNKYVLKTYKRVLI